MEESEPVYDREAMRDIGRSCGPSSLFSLCQWLNFLPLDPLFEGSVIYQQKHSLVVKTLGNIQDPNHSRVVVSLSWNIFAKFCITMRLINLVISLLLCGKLFKLAFSLLEYNDHWYVNVSTIKIPRAFLKPTHKVECIKFSFIQVMVR